MSPYVLLKISSETWKLNIAKRQCFMLNTEIRERYVTSKCEVFKLFSAIIIPSSIFNS